MHELHPKIDGSNAAGEEMLRFPVYLSSYIILVRVSGVIGLISPQQAASLIAQAHQL